MALFIFAENEKNDLFIGPDNKISTLEDVDAASQTTKSAVEVQQGEALYNVDTGIPTDEVVWSGSPNLQQFDFYARRAILSKDDVTEVTSFDAEIQEGKLVYQAQIETIYGSGVFNGSI